MYGTKKDPKSLKQPWERIKLKISNFLISNYITKLEQSKQSGLGIKMENIDLCNRTAILEMNSWIYGQLMNNKKPKYAIGKSIVSQIELGKPDSHI